MTTSNTHEDALEALIERNLIGSTREERGADADIDAQQPDAGHYYWGAPADMDKSLAIDTRRLRRFLEATQANEIAKYHGKDLFAGLAKRIAQCIQQYGIVDVLRKGVDYDYNTHFTLFYPKPSPADSAALHTLYAANQWSVTRQQTFSIAQPGLEIDMVLFVNGLPLFTMELKNAWTHQTARFDGIKQYREDRNPKEPLLNFGRCLAHFALDTDEIYFTTKLDGKKTYFMPFNKGLPEGQGAGNPVNPGGHRTAYFWEEILRKDVLADIISNYALFDYGEAKTGKRVAHVMKNAKKLIFPRYHQLDVVRSLVAEVADTGVGDRYLIQHSAGSGKSNSLTWLAFRLIETCPASMDACRARALDEKLYSSVIVVTDRRLLDKQITDNIRLFGKSDSIIAHADTSEDLRRHIENGKKIIITTIQKFPFICNTIADVSDRNFAIIIDEAHSSQSGRAAGTMNAAIQKDGDTDGSDIDELIEKMIKDNKMSSNCSYFAFTATPKKETLERFGIARAEGGFRPFHLYSMKQAIEEGFIKDVLRNYTTYQSYYEIAKSIEENPQFKNSKAQKALRRMVERDPKTIAVKAGVILDHFDAKMFRAKKLRGKAKAMVVTKDIECAIEYYKALIELARERKLPYRILISFSGTKTIKGIDYTESDMNGFADTLTPEVFNGDDCRILVVANKYLTGFDQPKLAAMYIDKPLDGVLAVQALSRLNRSADDLDKRSEDLFILDFFNKSESMKEAFDPYYTGTELSDATDINVLYDLQATLLDLGVYDTEDVNTFADLYFRGADASLLSPIIDMCAIRFNKEIEWADNGKADFKMKAKQFVRVYSKAAAIMTFENVAWEKLHWFLKLLIPKLIVKEGDDDNIRELLEAVDLSTYGLRRSKLNESIVLDAATSVLDPNKATMVNAGDDEEPRDPLDELVRQFNEKWFKGWEATPDEQKAKLISIARDVANDADYKELVVGNPDEQAVATATAEIIDRIMRKHRKSDMSLYREYKKADFRDDFVRVLKAAIENMDWLGEPSITHEPVSDYSPRLAAEPPANYAQQ